MPYKRDSLYSSMLLFGEDRFYLDSLVEARLMPSIRVLNSPGRVDASVTRLEVRTY